MKRSHVVTFFMALCMFWPGGVYAGLSDQVGADFAPVDGVVVMPVDGEFLIDLDAGKGLAAGDLLAVVEAGEKIVHPVTGELLGSVEQVKGLLQAVRLKTGYSYARPLGEAGRIAKGDRIRRFANIRTGFWDYDGAGEVFFASLQRALPDLDWENYVTAQAERPQLPKPLPGGDPPLVFILKDGTLEVRGASFEVLRSYPVGDSGLPVAGQEQVSPPVENKQAPAPVAITDPVPPTPAPVGVVAKPVEQPVQAAIIAAAPRQQQGVWDLRQMAGDAVGLEVIDLDGDGLREVAVLFRDHLEVGRFSDGVYQGLDRFDLPSFAKGVAVDGVDLDRDGKAELYLSMVKEYKPVSTALVLEGGMLQVRQERIPYLLRRVIMPDGEIILLGQQLEGGNQVYSPGMHQLELLSGKVASAGNFQHPWGSILFGLQPFQAEQTGLLFANLGLDRGLQVLRPDGEKIWESSQPYGGTVVGFDIVDYTGGASFSTLQILIKPRIERGPDGTLLVPQNDGESFTSLLSNFGPSRLVAMRWQDERLQEAWRTADQEGGMVDFRLADADNDGRDELVIALIDTTPGAMSKGRARVMVFELP